MLAHHWLEAYSCCHGHDSAFLQRFVAGWIFFHNFLEMDATHGRIMKAVIQKRQRPFWIVMIDDCYEVVYCDWYVRMHVVLTRILNQLLCYDAAAAVSLFVSSEFAFQHRNNNIMHKFMPWANRMQGCRARNSNYMGSPNPKRVDVIFKSWCRQGCEVGVTF